MIGSLMRGADPIHRFNFTDSLTLTDVELGTVAPGEPATRTKFKCDAEPCETANY